MAWAPYNTRELRSNTSPGRATSTGPQLEGCWAWNWSFSKAVEEEDDNELYCICTTYVVLYMAHCQCFKIRHNFKDYYLRKHFKIEMRNLAAVSFFFKSAVEENVLYMKVNWCVSDTQRITGVCADAPSRCSHWCDDSDTWLHVTVATEHICRDFVFVHQNNTPGSVEKALKQHLDHNVGRYNLQKPVEWVNKLCNYVLMCFDEFAWWLVKKIFGHMTSVCRSSLESRLVNKAWLPMPMPAWILLVLQTHNVYLLFMPLWHK